MMPDIIYHYLAVTNAASAAASAAAATTSSWSGAYKIAVLSVLLRLAHGLDLDVWGGQRGCDVPSHCGGNVVPSHCGDTSSNEAQRHSDTHKKTI
jgi:hypothetical protein